MALIVLATTHRVAPGLLSWRAWSALRSAGRVLTGTADHPQLPYLREAGVAVEVTAPDPRALLAAGAEGGAVWLADPAGDEELMRAIGTLVVSGGDVAAEVEVLHGSYDLPGARLLDLVQVMDTLRRECPWDRKQTHASLVPYLLEEAYEVADTITGGEGEPDHAALREELGDVLMQVAFHARVAEERDDETRFTIDDVAAGIVDKLVRRHPHVFAGVRVADADEVNANWEQIKAAERQARDGAAASVFDGVPAAQPALSLAAQVQRRAARIDAPEELYAAGDDLGGRLFDAVRAAAAEGLDPEAALRAAARAFRERVQKWEQAKTQGRK
ncbi:nucleoside triphosphate pyrophosphohydrolase [Actinomadura craniellae]|uniref:Nucleoside triphosphate pyrophosphohydrolase n=1 Tax=Actinomadura craniellae TaxID=2231787 RepID=A0A365H7U3_9ACTN|nr:MazG family protein [Actinomadura craniellae]RAY14333.1 nucleoside triphosphate pyrophosphohydrolase [Actinomadura craniellae]